MRKCRFQSEDNWDKEGERGTLCNDKRVNFLRRYNTPSVYAATGRELRTHDAETDRTKGKTDKSAVRLRDPNTSLTETDSTRRSIVTKDT